MEDLPEVYGVSLNRGYAAVNDVCSSISEAFPMAETFTDDKVLKELEQHFGNKSTNGAIRGCVGAIDGLHVQIEKPQRKRDGVTDSLKYKSGRYKTYGLNVQAVSDARRRCMYLDISFGGAANDRKAAASIMHDLNKSLPDGYFLVGDAAYLTVDNMRIVTPYTKPDFEGCTPSELKERDAYNFYVSQLRITV